MQGRLVYDPAADCYSLGDYDIHCGQCVQVRTPSGWQASRVELDAEGIWYLVGTPYRGMGLMYVDIMI